ncbi:MAG: hypothetical protein ACJ72W_12740 [Actinoallomurus sp.]
MVATSVPPQGWSSVLDTGGLPLWRWAGGQVCVATGDTDQFRFLAVALRRFDEMIPPKEG